MFLTQPAISMQAAGQIEGVVEHIASGTEELAAQSEQISHAAEIQRQRMTDTSAGMWVNALPRRR